jgi:hypothetical protein
MPYKSTVIAVFATMAILVACGGTETGEDAAPAAGEPVSAGEPATDGPAEDSRGFADIARLWTLEIPDDLRTGGIPADFSITIEFTDSGAFSGSSGCNRYSGQAELSQDGAVAFGPTAATRMACPEAQMELESSYLTILGRVTAFRLNGGKLELFREDQRVLTFLPNE